MLWRWVRFLKFKIRLQIYRLRNFEILKFYGAEALGKF